MLVKMSNPVVHFEIGCKDKARSEAFFTGLFGWKLTPAGPASLIDTGGGGINGHLTSKGQRLKKLHGDRWRSTLGEY